MNENYCAPVSVVRKHRISFARFPKHGFGLRVTRHVWVVQFAQLSPSPSVRFSNIEQKFGYLVKMGLDVLINEF